MSGTIKTKKVDKTKPRKAWPSVSYRPKNKQAKIQQDQSEKSVAVYLIPAQEQKGKDQKGKAERLSGKLYICRCGER